MPQKKRQEEVSVKGAIHRWVPRLAVLGWTALVLTIFVSFVNLKPEVSKNFFFSSDDPQFQQDKQIAEIFPEPQQIIIGVKGDIKSDAYAKTIDSLTQDLEKLEFVFGVQSITEGPGKVENAFKSPLWRRALISDDGLSTNIVLFIEDINPDGVIPKIEKILGDYESSGFQTMMTGAPYILYQIRKNLMRDLKVFSAAAFVIFGLLLLLIFRDVHILAGTLIACLNASALTLIITTAMHIEIGVLTANLSTIVFVLTLSHCIFISFNWRREREKPETENAGNMVIHALKVTLQASFWSMLTTLLGFGSLMFVQATPLQKLGLSGAIGTFIAFLTAYLIFPWFLDMPTKPVSVSNFSKRIQKYVSGYLRKKHTVKVLILSAVILATGTGIARLNTDPSLLTYFKEGSELRSGLEYMDRNGGSSPLKLVLKDSEGNKFNTEEADERLLELQLTLEAHEGVGNIISLPLVMAEGRQRIPLSFFLTWEWLLDILEQPIASNIASYFVTPDRDRAFFVLRMKESGRTYSRESIQEQIKGIVWANKFVPDLMGGVFILQGKLAELVTGSLFWGLALLIGLFVVMGLALSKSLKVTLGMFLSLCLVPAWMLGVLGYFNVPLDIISAPATNIAIAMGVDSMIHVLIFARREWGNEKGDWEAWFKSRESLWKPVLSSTFIVMAGFGIFAFSEFPPTQRFGFAVILGTLISPLTALFILPVLSFPRKKQSLG